VLVGYAFQFPLTGGYTKVLEDFFGQVHIAEERDEKRQNSRSRGQYVAQDLG
jgi:hypothetical protein